MSDILSNERSLNDFIKEVHQNAVEHGWWEEERSLGEVISLIHSEISEALEEYRSGHEFNEVYYSCSSKDEEKLCHNSITIGGCKRCSLGKPEGIPIELADVIIRVFDFIGSENEDVPLNNISNLSIFSINDNESCSKYKNFGSFITACHVYCSNAYIYDPVYWLFGLVMFIKRFCGVNDIHIENLIEDKHEFNKTRPYKHGGKKM